MPLCGPRASSSLLLELVDREPQPEHRGVEVASQLVVEGAGLRYVRHELERVADVLGRRFLGPPLGAAAALGVPAARAAATALASRAPLGLHQGERLPALARAPLDPAPPIGYSPIGEQALLAREARHAAICLVAGIPATSPRGQICSVTRLVAIAVLTGLPPRLAAQAPHAANPERPSVATHAYTVAPGYAELEQGVRAQGLGNFRDQTTWEFNLKIGVAPPVQLGLFGTGYNRTEQGNGVGDVGVALKLRRDLSATHSLALVPAVTLPTGDQSLGLGAGRVLGSLLAVWSFELGGLLHADLNAGPVGIGAGRPQALGTASFTRGLGRWGVAAEVYGYTSGSAGAGQGGLLGAVTVRPAEWLVVDGGGVVGLGAAGRDQLFLGVTTNLGRIFK